VLGVLPELDRLVAEAMRQTGVPGLSLAVVHEDEVVHLAGFGSRRAGSPERVDAHTVFQLASLSKPIASTVVAALVGDGLVAWDDPVQRHDPGFALHDAWVTREVTLRDMFAHRSGLPEHAGDALEDLGYGRAEILHRLRYIAPGGGFRSRYAYTNFGLTAAAVAAANAAGTAWEALCAERLYWRLDMGNTSSRFADFIAAPNRAAGHVRQGERWAAEHTREPDGQSPAGGVSSSARDMARWLRLHLGHGTLDGREIVSAAALADTYRPQIVSTPARDPLLDRPSFYGLGWGIGYDDRGRVLCSHSGAFNLGAATCVNVLPAERLGIVVLTNAQPVGVAEALCRSFLDLALKGRVERDWLALFGPLLAEALAPAYGTAVDYASPVPRPTAPLPAEAYAGAYHSDLFGQVRVTGAGSAGLAFALGPQLRPFALRHFDRDVFTYQPVGENAFGPSSVAFAIGASGKATSVTVEILNTGGQGRFDRLPV
jgi:CubicO group peptidase (beta-lactamase class C family)